MNTYNIFLTEKNDKGQDVFGELLWQGRAPPATIYNLDSDTVYKLSMLGYVKSGKLLYVKNKHIRPLPFFALVFLHFCLICNANFA